MSNTMHVLVGVVAGICVGIFSEMRRASLVAGLVGGLSAGIIAGLSAGIGVGIGVGICAGIGDYSILKLLVLVTRKIEKRRREKFIKDFFTSPEWEAFEASHADLILRNEALGVYTREQADAKLAELGYERLEAENEDEANQDLGLPYV